MVCQAVKEVCLNATVSLSTCHECGEEVSFPALSSCAQPSPPKKCPRETLPT